MLNIQNKTSNIFNLVAKCVEDVNLFVLMFQGREAHYLRFC
jgi:hypothetical protein